GGGGGAVDAGPGGGDGDRPGGVPDADVVRRRHADDDERQHRLLRRELPAGADVLTVKGRSRASWFARLRPFTSSTGFAEQSLEFFGREDAVVVECDL